MWFDALINKNPELLVGIVNYDDVKRIAKIINAEKDHFICKKISFEIGLGGRYGVTKPDREPIIAMAFDIFDEKYLLEQKDKSIYTDLINLVNSMNKVSSLIKRDDIADILVHSGQFSREDFDQLKRILCPNREQVFWPLYDLYSQRRAKYKSWGISWTKNSYYSRFIEKVVQLYIMITGEPFVCQFERGKGNIVWDPITPGPTFVKEFHDILNRIALAYKITPFSDKTLKHACEENRKQINSSRKVK